MWPSLTCLIAKFKCASLSICQAGRRVMKHISVLPNLQTSKFWQKCFAQINLQIWFYPEEIDACMKTLKKYDPSKLIHPRMKICMLRSDECWSDRLVDWAEQEWSKPHWKSTNLVYCGFSLDRAAQVRKVWKIKEAQKFTQTLISLVRAENGGRSFGLIKRWWAAAVWVGWGEDWGGKGAEAEARQGRASTADERQ